MNNIILSDYPKLHCPFVRRNFEVDKDDWKKYGRSLQLRSPEAYLAINKVNPGYEWVFEDKDTIAVEKLDGSNVKLKTEKGRLVALQNRKNIVDPLQIIKGKTFLIEGVFQAIGKGYIDENGEQDGELLGPKVQGNPYQLLTHLWYPFSKTIKHLSYRSFHEHSRTFDNWNIWFKDWLISRFATKRGNKNIMAEGVVFYNLRRKAENKVYRAKLRRDMFAFYYTNKVKIYNYN